MRGEHVAHSLPEAIAMVSAPGMPFETTEVTVAGVTTRQFVNAPATVRGFFDLARGVESTFLVYEDEEWTFDEVMREADALGHALVTRYGVRPGDRVAIAMRNLPEWVVAFAAILSVGAVSVSLNAWWTSEELAYAIDDAGPVVLIADAERAARAVEPARRAGVPIVGVRLGDEAEPAPGVTPWRDVVVRGAAMPNVPIEPDDDATILYTSGTTGRPKGAVSTHRAITQTIMAFAAGPAIIDARREPGESGSGLAPCFILVVPLFHVTGCIPVMMSCFSWHFKLVMMHRWEPERALELIERHRVTSFVGVPTQSWDLLESPDFSRYDTSSLSSIGGGGAPAPPTLVERVDRAFVKGRPSLAYGMTETNAYGPGNFGDDYVSHPTSTGRTPTIVMDVEIRDGAGRPVSVGDAGEIWVSSPTLIRGYWNQPEATADTLVDGWLRTGDLGRLDAEGFLYIEDRAKDMIIRGGENVYSAEVEAAIYEHPAVYEAAVFGLADERLGEEVACVVMLKSGEQLEVEELREHLRVRLAAFKVPTRIVLTREPLPRNPAGKMLKRQMPEQYFS